MGMKNMKRTAVFAMVLFFVMNATVVAKKTRISGMHAEYASNTLQYTYSKEVDVYKKKRLYRHTPYFDSNEDIRRTVLSDINGNVIHYAANGARAADLAALISHIIQRNSKAVDYLLKQQKQSGAVYIDSGLFNVWETINAVLAVLSWEEVLQKDFDYFTKKALKFLKTSENNDGMVLHRKEHNGSYCLETSSEYIRLLTLLKIKTVSEEIIKKKSIYLKKQQIADGTWKMMSSEIREDLQKFPSVIAFAFRALSESGDNCVYEKEALLFIKNTQNKDGHWGIDWRFYGTPFYAMEPVLDVMQKNNKAGYFNNNIKKAKKFILKSQRSDGSWFFKLDGFKNFPSAELQTALALSSLLHCNLEVTDIHIQKGIDWLLMKQREDGSWRGGYFPVPGFMVRKVEDIYATSQILMLFYRVYKDMITLQKCLESHPVSRK